MSKDTKEYRKRLKHYLSAMKMCKNLLDNYFITDEEYKTIEKKISQKYGISDGSLFK